MTAAPAAPVPAAETEAHLGHPWIRETVSVTATLCALVPALVPLALAGMPATHDGLLHVQRLIAVEAAVRQGAPFTRWLPDLAYGYGQPLLLYYAPLAYLPALVARLLGAGFVASVELATGLALVLSALAMYLLARSFAGRLGACASAVVYGLLPYQLVDIYVRGALAESWAFVWLPVSAWCMELAWRDGRRRWSVGLALSLAGLVLTHNVTALLFLPALAELAAIRYWYDSRRAGRVWWPPVAALGLGLALSAWFWLPAIAERGLVQITEMIEPELFTSFFLRNWPPFRLDPLYDYQRPVSVVLGYPIFWPQLGLMQLLVTLAGAAGVARARTTHGGIAIWAGLLVVGGILLQVGPAARLYDVVPLLAFVQFPWRLLALVGLGSAILAGLFVETVSARADVRSIAAAVVVVGAIVTAVGRLQPETVPVDERSLSSETIERIELADYGLGTTHSGEYLPVSSGQRNAARFRKTMLDAGGAGSRAAPATPSELRVGQLDWRPNRITVAVDAAAPDRLTLHQFAFPGWTVRLDGAAVPVEAAGPVGLLAVDVPAGRHVVEVRWSLTPLRAAAAAVSLLGIVALALLAAGRTRPMQIRAAIAGLAVAGVVAVIMTLDWPAGPGLPGAPQPQSVDDTLTFVDAHTDVSRLSSDRLALVRAVWLVRQAPTIGYRAHVEVQAANGAVHRSSWANEPDSRLWERGELVPTTMAVRLPSDFPAGEAQLQLVFERPDNAPPVALGVLPVPLMAPAISVAAPVASTDIGSDVRLGVLPTRGGGLPRARVGGSLDLPLQWEALAPMPNVERELVAVGVVNVPGGEVLSGPARPGDWFSPLPFWQTGEMIEQRLRIAVPPRTPPGSYPLSIRVYDRALARGGAAEPGASEARPRGRPIAELAVGDLTVTP